MTGDRKNRSRTTVEREYFEAISQSNYWKLFWIPDKYTQLIDGGNYREYNLSFPQKVFLVLENPTSCVLASYVSIGHIIVIALNVSSVIVSSLASNQFQPHDCPHPACNNDPSLCPGRTICPPIVKHVFSRIDLACVIIFTIEFAIRICLCWIMPTRLSGTIPLHWDDCEKEMAEQQKRPVQEEPFYSRREIFLRYFFSLATFIDMASIIPTYLVIYSTRRSKSLTYLRVFRMIRLLRIVQLNRQGRMVIDLIQRTLYRSREAMGILLFYLALIILFFAAIAYAVEEGKYTINDDYPNGAYLRPNGYGGKAESNFDSIPSAIYYIIVTICTVGYGDMVPTTIPGRAAASIVCLLGIIVTAMPISIISSNFSIEYKRYLERKHQFDKVMSVRDRRHKLLVKQNFAEASFALNSRVAITDILKKYKTTRLSFYATKAPTPIVDGNRLPLSERPAVYEQSLRIDRIYQSESDKRDSTLDAKSDIDNNDRSTELADEADYHSSMDADESDSSSIINLLPLPVEADPMDYSVPSHVKSILRMNADLIEQLNENELRVLFLELRGSYKKLFNKNIRAKELVTKIEDVADQIFDPEIMRYKR